MDPSYLEINAVSELQQGTFLFVRAVFLRLADLPASGEQCGSHEQIGVRRQPQVTPASLKSTPKFPEDPHPSGLGVFASDVQLGSNVEAFRPPSLPLNQMRQPIQNLHERVALTRLTFCLVPSSFHHTSKFTNLCGVYTGASEQGLRQGERVCQQIR